MTSAEAPKVLRDMLSEAGVDLEQPSPDDLVRAWEVFKRFGAVPADDVTGPDRDAMLVQYGVYDWYDDDGEHFELDFTRQFSYDDEDGEHDHMAQLHCTFIIDATPELREVPEENLWSLELPLDEFFSRVEAMTGFAGVMELKPVPQALRVEIEEV